MSREHSIVRLDNRSRNLRRRSNGETHLGLTAVVDCETLEKKRSKTGSSSSSSGVEDKESLKSSTVISHLADLVKDGINDVLSDRVVTTSVVIGCILLSVDDGLRVVEIAVLSGANRVTDSGLKIDHDCTRDMLAGLGLAEKGVVRAVLNAYAFVSGHGTIWANSMLHAVKLPAGVTDR
jgi:hypothetical protein